MKICSNLRSEGISWCFALSIEGSIKLWLVAYRATFSLKKFRMLRRYSFLGHLSFSQLPR